jgi:hypothetical protein
VIGVTPRSRSSFQRLRLRASLQLTFSGADEEPASAALSDERVDASDEVPGNDDVGALRDSFLHVRAPAH